MKRASLILLALAMTGSVCWAKAKIGKEHYEEIDGDRRYTVGAPFNVVDRALNLPLQAKWHADLGGAIIDVTRAGGKILALAESGVYAVDPATGATLWRYVGASGRVSPIQSNGRVAFFASYTFGADKDDHGSSRIHVLDLKTGAPRWTYEKAGGEFTALSLKGGRLHAVLTTPNAFDPDEAVIVTLNAADGGLMWEKGIAEGDLIFSDAIVAKGLVAVAMKKVYEFNLGGVGKLMKFAAKFEAKTWTYELAAYDAATGAEAWTRQVEGKLPLPTQVKRLQVTEDGVLYPLLGRGSEDPKGDTYGLPFALDIKTGAPVWQQETWSRDNETKYWANAGQLVADRYLYGQGIGDQAQVMYVMCVDVKKGEMLWRENVQSKKLGNLMKGMWAAARTSMSESHAMNTGGDSYTVYKVNPAAAAVQGDAMSIFTHYGAIMNFPGEDSIRRYVGKKKLWETKYKKKKKQQIIMPNRITKNYVLAGDSSGKVRFFDLLKGKTDKKQDIDLGGPLYQIRVDDDLMLFAAENGLHAY